MIKIKAIQENPKVGDIEGNTELLERHLESAKAEGVNLLVFSEMFLSGYPPEDLVMREDFLYEMKRSIDSIIPKTKEISLILGLQLERIIDFIMQLFLYRMENL